MLTRVLFKRFVDDAVVRQWRHHWWRLFVPTILVHALPFARRVLLAICLRSWSRRLVLDSEVHRIDVSRGITLAVMLSTIVCNSCNLSPSGHARTRRWWGNRRSAAALVFFSTRWYAWSSRRSARTMNPRYLYKLVHGISTVLGLTP